MGGTKRKTIAIIMAIMLMMQMSISVSYASKKSEIKNKINDKQQELSDGKKKEDELNKQIDDLESSRSKLAAEVADIQNQVTALQQDIDTMRKEVEKNKKALDDSEKDLDDRLRNMYKSGSIGFVDVVLESGDVTELLSNVDMIKRIYTNDKDVVSKLKKKYDKVKNKQQELQQAEDDLNLQQATLAEKENELKEEEKKLVSKAIKLSESNKSIESELSSLNSQASAIASAARSGSSGGKYKGGVMGWPVPSSHSVSSEYGWRFCPYHKVRELHSGMDIPASTGTKVVAASAGTVISASYDGGYGNYVLISHSGGISTLYAHNSQLVVKAGQKVKRGQTIAKAGSTGASTGPHCHFEVRVNGNPVNPRSYL